MRKFILLLILTFLVGHVAWMGAQDAPKLKRVATEKLITRISDGEFKPGTLTVGNDMRRFAIVRKNDSGWSVEVDGKVEATVEDVIYLDPVSAQAGAGILLGVQPMILSADSRHLAFGMSLGKKSWAMVHDGKQGKAYKRVLGPVLSADGQRFAYAALLPQGWCVVVDGAEGKAYKKVGSAVFSPDGKHLAYAADGDGEVKIVLDGVEGKGYDSFAYVPKILAWAFREIVIAKIFFGADGRLAYWAKQDGQWHSVVDGKESEAYEDFSNPSFSPDGKRLAFAVARGKKWSVIVDGQAYGSFENEIDWIVFSPDSKHFAFATELEDNTAVFLDGRSIGSHEEVGLPAFSPDGSRIAYAARIGKKWTLAVDGVPQKPYLFANNPTFSVPVFSPDGSHLAYVITEVNGGQRVVVDGVGGKLYQTVLGSRVVFDDNSHFHYLVHRAPQILLVEEELSAEPEPL